MMITDPNPTPDSKDPKVMNQEEGAVGKPKYTLESLAKDIEDVQRILRTHKHEGNEADGSERLQREIDLLAGQSLGSGGVGSMTGFSDPANDRTIVAMGTGRDQSAADGLKNSIIYVEHQYLTEATTKQTFFYGIRGPFYVGPNGGIIVSGEDTFQQSTFAFKPDELVGAYLVVNSEDNSTFESYQITANTSQQITIDGTWGFSGSNLSWTVSMAIYNGSANYPWRRLYTGDLTGGGIRFGYGPTGGGQNGLLYMDAAGNLFWRNKAGSSTQLN